MKYNRRIDSLKRVSNLQKVRDSKIRMHAGERVYSFSDCFLDEFKQTISSESFTEYPNLFALKEKLAIKHGVSIDNIFISAGSDYSLAALFYTFVEEGTHVLMPEARFPMYDVYLSQVGGGLLEIPYKKERETLKLDVFSVQAACSEVRLVVVGNPNSPVGDVLSIEDFEHLEKYGCPIVIDQAYAEYGCTNLPISCIDKNYVFVNTFSKAFGAAGIRVGYTIASKEIISKLDSFRMMFEVSTISAKFAEYLLDNELVMKEYVESINAEKHLLENFGVSVLGGNWVHLPERYAETLKDYTFKAGCKLPHTLGNFIKIGIFPGLHQILEKSSVHTP